MTPTSPPPGPDREQLRQEWLAAANDAFERMFAADEQDQLGTFLQRQTRGGAEAVLQVRAAYLSQNDRSGRLWDQPRPYTRSAGPKRLRPAA